MSKLRGEPVLTGITTLVVSTIGLAVAFGAHVTEVQGAAIVGFVAAVYGVGVLVRSMVTPTKGR